MKLAYVVFLSCLALYSMEVKEQLAKSPLNKSLIKQCTGDAIVAAFEQTQTHPSATILIDLFKGNHEALNDFGLYELTQGIQNKLVNHPSHKRAISRYLRAAEQFWEAHAGLKKVETGLLSETWKKNLGELAVPETGEPKDLIKANPITEQSKFDTNEFLLLFSVLMLRKQERAALAESCIPKE